MKIAPIRLTVSNVRRDLSAAAWLEEYIMPLYPDIAHELLSARKRLWKLTRVLCFLYNSYTYHRHGKYGVSFFT